MVTTVPQTERFQLPFPESTFGNRFGIKGPYYGPQGHRGQDFLRAGGTAVPAIGDGLVWDVLWSNALGNVVVVRHNPTAGPDVYSFSCHLRSVKVREGQAIKIRQTVGAVGTTGSASTGNHLHLAMSHEPMGGVYGEVFDPVAFIKAHAVPLTPAKPIAKAKYTVARKGEGLYAIAARMRISGTKIKALNPNITAPDYIVRLGQKVRYA